MVLMELEGRLRELMAAEEAASPSPLDPDEEAEEMVQGEC